MAAFTSVGIGNWNDGATWGNDSPGSKGTDWPGIAGDTASIGHTVTYNVSEANELGDVTITNGGKLAFSDGTDRKLTLGHNDLTIQSGGELEIGIGGDIFSSKAEVLFNTTSDNAKGLLINNGGKLTLYGDPAYYGSDMETFLAANAENTDGDTSIITKDDMSAKWNVGDRLIVHKRKSFASYASDCVMDTIASITGTTIVLTADVVTADAGVGDTWEGIVLNLSRNINFQKYGLTYEYAWGTLRPKFLDSNASGNNNVTINNAEFFGFYGIYSSYDLTAANASFHNGQYGLFAGQNFSFTNVILASCYTLINLNIDSSFSGGYMCVGRYGHSELVNATSSQRIFSCQYPMAALNTEHSGITHGCNYAVRGGMGGSEFTGYYYGCTGLCYRIASFGTFKNAVIGFDPDGNEPYSMPIMSFSYNSQVKFINCKMPTSVWMTNRNDVRYRDGRLMFEHYNQVVNAHKIHHSYADIIKTACDGTGDAPSVDPDGGNGDCIEVSNLQSNLSADCHVEIFEHQFWATASVSKTYTYKIQTTMSTLAAGKLTLEAEYYGVSDITITKQEATAIAIRSSDTDWTQTIAVTVNPSQTGWVRIKMYLKQYEALDEVYIWPEVAIT